LFQRSATALSTINEHAFESGISDDKFAIELNSIHDDILDFLKKQLQTFQL